MDIKEVFAEKVCCNKRVKKSKISACYPDSFADHQTSRNTAKIDYLTPIPRSDYMPVDDEFDSDSTKIKYNLVFRYFCIDFCIG